MMNWMYFKNAWVWMQDMKTEFMKQKSLGYALVFAFSIATVFGFTIYLLDPNVHSFTDGIWYAWVTMTHVGYGDVVPTSFLGRSLASLLILLGLAVFALFTAMLSTILIGRDVGYIAREENQILLELKRLHERLDQLESTDRKHGPQHPVEESSASQME